MAGTQGMRRKEDFASLITGILDEAARTRRGFTPQVVAEFYDEGMRASQARASRQEERPQQREERLREATPSRQLGNIVARRAEEAEQRAQINPVMTKRAIESAVDLGERLELAASGRRLALREWMSR